MPASCRHVLPAPDAERRLSKEDAKGSGNILNWQPAVSKAKKQAINAANPDAVELPAALAPSAKWAFGERLFGSEQGLARYCDDSWWSD